MKNLFLTAVLIFTSSLASAQINLESTYYTSNLGDGKLSVINLSVSGYKYLYRAYDTLRIYNLNHSLWKTIYMSKPSGSSISINVVITEELFNLDSKVEVIYSYNKNSTYGTRIINEDSVIIKTIADCKLFEIYSTGSNGWKLIADIHNQNFSNTTKEVYSLPGTGVTLKVDENYNELSLGSLGSAFPNPTNQLINFPYDIPNGENFGMITIMNISGIVIESYTIDNTFNNLIGLPI